MIVMTSTIELDIALSYLPQPSWAVQAIVRPLPAPH
jgi:hypothetical protein